MKALTLASFLYFFLLSTHALVPGLLEQGREMVSLLEQARTCQVQKTRENSLELCTGLKLSSHDLNFLKGLDLPKCKSFLKQMKYKVKEVSIGDKVKGVPKKDLDHFFNTTKLAYILHQEKIILFKNEAKRGDCLHEVLHFYQRHRPAEHSLSPLKRKTKERNLQFLLEKSIGRVEFYEKKGELEKAKEMANELQPFIQLQREWVNLINWLDEKEIYQVFFDFGDLIGTGERDYDVAVANLVRLKESLPWDLNERVLYAANQELNKKYKLVPIPKKIEKDEEYYSKRYQQGKISRDQFEKKVIALRKFRAQTDKKKAKSLYDKLKAELRLRSFTNQKNKSDTVIKKISFQIKNDLFEVSLQGQKYLVDTGAQVSVLSPELLKNVKRGDIELYGAKNLQTSYGKSLQAPIVKIKKRFTMGGAQIPFLVGAVGDLGLPGYQGIIGMDFFSVYNGGQWILDVKKGEISKGKLKGQMSFYLESNGLGKIDSLEFYCSQEREVKLRLDSGSQYLGEKKKLVRGQLKASCLSEGIFSQMKEESPNSIIFSRGVHINLGTPYLRKFSRIGLNLSNKKLVLEKK